MSDEPIGGAYQPSGEPGQASTPPAGEPPAPITQAHLDALRKELLDEARRVAQSLTDKQESRVDKRLRQWESKLKNDGVVVDDTLRQRARQELALQELTVDDSDGDTAAQPVAPADPKVVEVRQKMAELQTQYGFAITDADDEFGELNFSDPNPDRFLKAYIKRMQEKADRLAVDRQQQAGPPGSRAPMAVQGAAGGNRAEQITKRLEELRRNPFAQGAQDERAKLTAELRQLVGP